MFKCRFRKFDLGGTVVKTKTTVFFVISALLISHPACVAALTATHFTNAEMDLFDLDTEFSVQCRIGDSAESSHNRTYELAIGNTIYQPGVTKQHTWISDVEVEFTLTAEISAQGLYKTIFEADNNKLRFTPNIGSLSNLNDVYIQTVVGTGAFGTRRIELGNLILNGDLIGDSVDVTVGGDNLVISGGSLVSGFILTGTAKMTYDTIAPPTDSDMAFQIGVGSVNGQQVPEPATLAFLGLGCVVLVGKKK